MTVDNRVIWSEGMFLRTQHFQQQDRAAERLVRDATRGLIGHGWGVRALDIDSTMLGQGKVGIRRADGILSDGTTFAVPDLADHPDPITVTEAMGPGIVYLCLPVAQEGAVEFDRPGQANSGARYLGHEIQARDAVAGSDSGATPIETGRLRFSLAHEQADLGAKVCLGVCRVSGVQSDGSLTLDREFVPPCLTIAASDFLHGYLNELSGLLETIADSRVGFVTGRKVHGLGDISDFLVLQLVNRAAAVAQHISADRRMHPEAFFRFLLGLAGEASTFIGPTHRPIEISAYSHDNPGVSFVPLLREVSRLMIELARPDPRSVQIPLRQHERHRSIHTADVQDRSLYADAVFVLAVNAALAPEKIRENFPRQIKLAPAEALAELVQTGRPGIPLRHLPSVPRQIPMHRGMIYFELDRQDEHWRRLSSSAGLALHIVDEFPDLELECWAIRD